MSTLDERIAKGWEKLEKLKRQKRAQAVREKKRQAAIDKDRLLIIGKIVSEHFPEVLRFQPHRTEAENKTEFAPLTHFISVLAADINAVSQLKEKAANHALLDSQ